MKNPDPSKLTLGEYFGLALLPVFALLVFLLFTREPTEREQRALDEAHRTVAEIRQREANNRYACAHGYVEACD